MKWWNKSYLNKGLIFSKISGYMLTDGNATSSKTFQRPSNVEASR